MQPKKSKKEEQKEKEKQSSIRKLGNWYVYHFDAASEPFCASIPRKEILMGGKSAIPAL